MSSVSGDSSSSYIHSRGHKFPGHHHAHAHGKPKPKSKEEISELEEERKEIEQENLPEKEKMGAADQPLMKRRVARIQQYESFSSGSFSYYC